MTKSEVTFNTEPSSPIMAEGRMYANLETKLDPKDERRQRESFRKRKKTLFKNANAISKRCKAEVYVVLLRKGKWFTFTSTEKLGWPPTAESMANVYPLPNATTSANYEPTKSGSDPANSPPSHTLENGRRQTMEGSAFDASSCSGSPATIRRDAKRTFLIPRAPKLSFDVDLRVDMEEEGGKL